MLILIEKIPEGVSLSPDLKERARHFLHITYLGHSYYIPVTIELIKILKSMGINIEKVDNQYQINAYKRSEQLESFIRDLIASLYLQIRDTVGSEVYKNLSSEIHEGLERMFEKNLSAKIEDTMQKKLEDKS